MDITCSSGPTYTLQCAKDALYYENSILNLGWDNSKNFLPADQLGFFLLNN